MKGITTEKPRNTKGLKKLINIYLSLTLGILLTTSGAAYQDKQSAKYNMRLSGVNIGELSVCQTSKQGKVYIEVVTDVNVKVIFSYRVKYIQKVVYDRGILQTSHIETYKNGKLHSEVWLKLQNNSYVLVRDGSTSKINETITYSGSLVYFNEPKGITKIYKERSGEMKKISSIDKHVYTINDEKEKEISTYFYENGILQFLKAKHPMGTIEFKKIA